MANKITVRQGLEKDLPTLASAEPAYTTDTRKFFVGTGSGNVNMGGSQWYTGTAMSGTSTATNYYSYSTANAKVGDYYLHTTYGYFYQCTTAGTGTVAKWTYKGTLKGDRGATGATGATGAKGNTGDAGKDLQAVYSTTPTQVGTWIDGKAIYRVVWSFTSTQVKSVINCITANMSDMPNYPRDMDNCTLFLNERYAMKVLSGIETIVVADRHQLKTLVTSNSYTNLSYTIYAIVEYVK